MMRILKTKYRLVIIILGAIIAALGIYGWRSSRVISPICISEVCSSNMAAAHDDYGNYGADYVELYNVSGMVIDIAGWGLTDDASNPHKFTLPHALLEPQQTLIVWCDEPDAMRDAELELYDVVRDIHGTGFRLSGGETCTLTDPSGEISVNVTIPLYIQKDKVYATSVISNGLYFVCNPSPYYVEVEANPYTDIETLDEPEYSLPAGWYQNDIEVEITSDEGEIYYTLDGTDPDINSEKYSGAIKISNRSSEDNIFSSIERIGPQNDYVPDFKVDKCTVLKSIVVKDGMRSPIKSDTYIIGLDDGMYDDMSIMSISMSPEDLFGYENGIYTMGAVYGAYEARGGETYHDGFLNYNMHGRGWEREAHIEYFSKAHEKKFEQTVGIRIRGGDSRNCNQKSLSLYSREEYDGNTSFLYNPFDDTYGDDILNVISLRSGGSEEMYLTKMRDVLAQNLVSNRRVGVQRFEPCIVFINGEYWGLYNLQEKISECFIEEHYGVAQDDVVIVKRRIMVDKVKGGEDITYQDVLDYASSHELSDMSNYNHMESLIDIDSCIDYYATEVYMANPDTYMNNLAVWRTQTVDDRPYYDGKWRWLLYDLDEGLGMKKENSTADIDSFISGGYWIRLVDEDALFSALLKNEHFKEKFVTAFMDLANENFSYKHVKPVLDQMADIYKEADIQSQLRFRGEYDDNPLPDSPFEPPFSEQDYEINIQAIDDFFRERGNYITEYMGRDLGLKGELRGIKIIQDSEADVDLYINTLRIEHFEGDWEGEYYSDYPVRIKCDVKDGHKFAGWEIDGEIVSYKPELEMQLSMKDTSIKVLVK